MSHYNVRVGRIRVEDKQRFTEGFFRQTGKPVQFAQHDEPGYLVVVIGEIRSREKIIRYMDFVRKFNRPSPEDSNDGEPGRVQESSAARADVRQVQDAAAEPAHA